MKCKWRFQGSAYKGAWGSQADSALGRRLCIQFIHLFNCQSNIYFQAFREASFVPGLELSSGETEIRLFPQLWRKKTFQGRTRPCPAGGDNTVGVRVISLGNSEWMTSWAAAPLGEGEAADGGVAVEVGEKGQTSVFSPVERPCV